MTARLRTWWQQIKTHPVTTVSIALFSAFVVLVILGGYKFNWDWTGFNGNNKSGKTLWDWLQLLFIPVVLAVAGFWFNHRERKAAELRTWNEQKAAEFRAEAEREVERQRAKTERDIAEDNQREAALQAYIDKMAELMLHENFEESKYDGKAPIIARARTLTVLPRLDGKRKGDVIQFLYDANLVSSINLYGIDLKEAFLPYARLHGAFLDGANLRKAYLYGADLSNANLYGTDLSNANLKEANLSGTIIDDADLYKANLSGAIGTTAEQLSKAKSHKGATMPDRSIHL